MSIGILFPFTRATGSLGIVASTDNELDATASNILSLLVTNWGERPMKFTFGCNLIEFLFEQINDTTRQKIEDRIVEQCREWLPFVKLHEILISLYDDDTSISQNSINISLVFSILGKNERKRLQRTITFSR